MSAEFAKELKAAILRRDEGELVALKEAFRRSIAPLDLFDSLDFDEQQRESLAQDHAWMARVYGLLADASDDEMDAFEEPADDAHLDKIGRSFDKLLLAGLPPGQSNLIGHPTFIELPLIGAEEFRELRYEQDVKAAGATGEFLARRGLRPASFHLAMNGIATLIRDLLQDGDLTIAPETPVRLHRAPLDCVHSDGIDFQEAAMEIARVASLDLPRTAEEEQSYGRLEEIPLPRSRCLLNWIMNASLSKPLVFPGFVAEPAANDLLLRPYKMIPDVKLRWSATLAMNSSGVPGFVWSGSLEGAGPLIAPEQPVATAPSSDQPRANANQAMRAM